MDDNDILKLIKDQHLSDEEIKVFLKQLHQQPKTHKKVDLSLGYNYKFLIVSDLHIGHNNFREDIFEDTVKTANRERVDGILIPGDIIEGMSNRDGHIYEVAIPGITKQVDYAVDLLNQYKQPIYAILGNHDLMSMRKGNQGVHIGSDLENRVKNFNLLGDMRGDLTIGAVTLRLSHEGNSSYALSYSLQKIINGLTGGDKPHIICNGHLHKAMYMFYRNIHALESGTLEDQTDFMAMKGSPAHVGYWLLKIRADKNGLQSFSPTFYPYYD